MENGWKLVNSVVSTTQGYVKLNITLGRESNMSVGSSFRAGSAHWAAVEAGLWKGSGSI